MSLNKYLPHLIVIPEDDADRQIANGFSTGCISKQLRIEREAGGWMKAVDAFVDDYAPLMRTLAGRHVLLLIDFDDEEDRLERVRERIPTDVASRVFVIGSKTEPEDLRDGLGTFEQIGIKIADQCSNGTAEIWGHELLKHNIGELNRLRVAVCNILWP
jgi:hypothetical protein